MTCKALIIDDDPSIRNLLAAVLRREGFDVSTALDGEEGIRLLEDASARWDVVLLDLMMPRIDGHAVVARVQARHPWLVHRIIISTAFPQAAIGRLGFACPILPKPFNIEELMAAVRERIAAAPPIPATRLARASL